MEVDTSKTLLIPEQFENIDEFKPNLTDADFKAVDGILKAFDDLMPKDDFKPLNGNNSPQLPAPSLYAAHCLHVCRRP